MAPSLFITADNIAIVINQAISCLVNKSIGKGLSGLQEKIQDEFSNEFPQKNSNDLTILDMKKMKHIQELYQRFLHSSLKLSIPYLTISSFVDSFNFF